MSQRCLVFAGPVVANRVVTAIDRLRGLTEDVRLPDGTIETRARKPWCVPFQLADGRWAVPVKLNSRLAALVGRTINISGVDVTIPGDVACETIEDEDRMP